MALDRSPENIDAQVVFSPDAHLQHYTIDADSFRARLREVMGEDARLPI